MKTEGLAEEALDNVIVFGSRGGTTPERERSVRAIKMAINKALDAAAEAVRVPGCDDDCPGCTGNASRILALKETA